MLYLCVYTHTISVSNSDVISVSWINLQMSKFAERPGIEIQ